MLERKGRQFNENNPDKKSDGDSQSDTSINEKSTVKSFYKSTLVAQGQWMMMTKTSHKKRGQWRC